LNHFLQSIVSLHCFLFRFFGFFFAFFGASGACSTSGSRGEAGGLACLEASPIYSATGWCSTGESLGAKVSSFRYGVLKFRAASWASQDMNFLSFCYVFFNGERTLP